MTSQRLSPYYTTFRSPFSDLLALYGSAQGNYRCREFELNVLDCTDAYGYKGLMKECKVLFDDFNECVYSWKEKARYEEMRKERMRQYFNGERSKKNLWAEPPKVDSYYQTYNKDID